MQLSLNHKEHQCTFFRVKKRHINGLNFMQKPKKPVLNELLGFLRNESFFGKIQHRTCNPLNPLTSRKISEKS